MGLVLDCHKTFGGGGGGGELLFSPIIFSKSCLKRNYKRFASKENH